MPDRWTAEMRGEPPALVIKLRNCTDNESVCLRVKTLHDTQRRGLRHSPASLEMSSLEGGKKKKKKGRKKKGKYVSAVSATNDSGLVDFVKVLRGSIIRLVDESALAVGNARLTLWKLRCIT